MNEAEDFDAVIVGCGLIGASTALALRQSWGQYGLRIAIADRQPFDTAQAAYVCSPQRFDARVSALTLGSQRLFSRIGIWNTIEAMRSSPYRHMEVWDGEGTGSIRFHAADIGHKHLGTIVENSVVLTALTRALQEQSAADTIVQLMPFSVESLQREGDQRLLLTSAEGRQCRTRLLVAADGSNSRVREMMGFRTREWDYRQTAVVTTVETELPHQHTAWQRFTATGPLAFLPLTQPSANTQHFCSVVWSCPPDRARNLMSLSEPAFRLELGRCFEHRLGTIHWSDQRLQFPLWQRHATEYYRDHVVLIGDAAHTIHPLAGQGVNLGLLDAAALAGELAAGVAAGRKVNDPVLLSRYQRKRRGHNLGMMWLMEGFKHLFARQPPAVQWLRNAGLDAVDSLGPVKNQLARQAAGVYHNW